MNHQPNYEFYRASTVGVALADALDTLLVEQRIEPQLAMKVLTAFDKATSHQLRESVRAKMLITGHLQTYRLVDDVWRFVMTNVEVTFDDKEMVDVKKLKIVACKYLG